MVDYGKLQLKRPTSDLTSLQNSEVEISSVSQWKQLPLEPHKLKVIQCHDVESLIEEGIRGTPTSSMQHLEIIDCHFSRSLDKVCLPTTLKSLKFRECRRLEFLLPELFRCYHPSLETIDISRSGIDLYVPPTFSTSVFPRLINFSIFDLKGLNSLSISISEGEPTSLQYVTIEMCPNLEYIELPALDLAYYRIMDCSKLKLLKLQGDTIPTLMQGLRLIGCPQLLFHKDGLTSNLRELEIFNCDQLTPQVDWGLQRLASLTRLMILGGCQNLESFPEEHLLPSTLTTLQISGFPNLKCLNGRGLQQLTSLKYLTIRGCPKLQSLKEAGLTSLMQLDMKELELLSLTDVGLQRLTSLEILSISGCPKLQSLKEAGLTSLKKLRILNFLELLLLTDVGLQHLTSLEHLTIQSCPKLESLKEAALMSLMRLDIRNLPELLSLIDVGLQRLTYLEKLSISGCPKLQSLTREKLPDSLSRLIINQCPLLEQRCQFKEGQEWDYLSHIPQMFINYEPL